MYAGTARQNGSSTRCITPAFNILGVCFRYISFLEEPDSHGDIFWVHFTRKCLSDQFTYAKRHRGIKLGEFEVDALLEVKLLKHLHRFYTVEFMLVKFDYTSLLTLS